MRDILDHYLGGLILVAAGLGVIAFGAWERIPGDTRSNIMVAGISILTVGAGVFNVERKSARVERKVDKALTSQARVEQKVDANTTITTEAADAAKVAARKADVAADAAATARERS